MAGLLEGQTAIVYGGSGLVGSVVAVILAGEAANVVVHYRHNAAVATRVAADITALGGRAVASQADVTDEASIEALVNDTEERFGAIHIVVNAAHGQFEPKAVADMTWSDWDLHLDALKGHFLMCKSVLPIMRRQHYGRIVFISGGLSHRLYEGFSAYTTVKLGLNGFSKTLALEEGRRNITVNIVAPGKVVPMDAPESADTSEAWDEIEQRELSNAVLGRYATPEDVAHAVLYFVSPSASGITGQTLFVAGGEVMP